MYSVKSGYRTLIQADMNSSMDNFPLQSSETQQLFGRLWSLSVPPKLKINFWKAIHNYMPTYLNLHIRKLNVDTKCILCSDAAENIGHLLCSCHFSLHVFSEVGFTLPVIQSEQSWLMWLSHLFDSLSKEQLILLVVSFWSLWSCTISTALLNERVIEHWITPPMDTLKANFDASFNVTSATSISGIIVRNAEGEVMATGTFPQKFVSNPEMAKARACEFATQLSRDLGFSNIIIEGDASNVIAKVSSPFTHVSRRGNEVAHLLAQVSKEFQSPMVWIDEAPMQVLASIAKEKWWVAHHS